MWLISGHKGTPKLFCTSSTRLAWTMHLILGGRGHSVFSPLSLASISISLTRIFCVGMEITTSGMTYSTFSTKINISSTNCYILRRGCAQYHDNCCSISFPNDRFNYKQKGVFWTVFGQAGQRGREAGDGRGGHCEAAGVQVVCEFRCQGTKLANNFLLMSLQEKVLRF